jgi:cyclopropane-fatty-acyl-phospholipid synthase
MLDSNKKRADVTTYTSETGGQFWADRARKILAAADITLNGDRPWDLQVHDPRMFQRAILYGSLGLGEAYMDGWWDAKRLDEFFYRLIRARLNQYTSDPVRWLARLRNRLFNLQAVSRAFQVGEKHYDLGNDFFQAMLDRNMVYTCGYWAHANNLDEAQEHKLELVCRKLNLKPGQRILDIGCGWASFLRYAAERYGVQAVGVTISREQAELGRARCRGLPVDIRLQDYRELNEPFDHIVSLGMFEHVGHKNYRTYMEVAYRCLKDDGLFLLHTIGKHQNEVTDPWIAKYIFPNGEIPPLRSVTRALENLFVLEDLHNFGPDYDHTLMAWYRNFHAAWPQFQQRYGARFYRMWKYYLNCCAGAFRARQLQLWQLVLSRHGLTGGYRRPEF